VSLLHGINAPGLLGYGCRGGGELNKLAHNISFAHGIYAGIHWRSDTDTSIEPGEAVALSLLEDLAPTYNEKFTVRTLSRALSVSPVSPSRILPIAVTS
jgi:hypothetical protein